MGRKDKGFVEKLLPVLLSTGMVFGLVLLSGYLMEVLRAREAMSQVARAYLLEMETVGYLARDRALQMQEALETYGLGEVSLAGSTTSPVDYGERIRLCVDGRMELDYQLRIPFLYDAPARVEVPIQFALYSTAKH